MSNCFESPDSNARSRLLHAISFECAKIADEIAALGAQVSSAGIARDAAFEAFQSFDYLAQHARSQSMMTACLARGELCVDQLMLMIEEIPLPAVRQRLGLALGAMTVIPVGDHDETVFWLETP